MSQVCICENPDIDRTSHNTPYCRKCGYFWIQGAGSKLPIAERKESNVAKMLRMSKRRIKL